MGTGRGRGGTPGLASYSEYAKHTVPYISEYIAQSGSISFCLCRFKGLHQSQVSDEILITPLIGNCEVVLWHVGAGWPLLPPSIVPPTPSHWFALYAFNCNYSSTWFHLPPPPFLLWNMHMENLWGSIFLWGSLALKSKKCTAVIEADFVYRSR